MAGARSVGVDDGDVARSGGGAEGRIEALTELAQVGRFAGIQAERRAGRSRFRDDLGPSPAAGISGCSSG